MLTIGIIFLFFGVVLMACSAWELDKVILASFLIGLVCLEASSYANHGNWNILSIIGNLTVFFTFFYFVSIYKIMNRKVFSLIQAGEFKEYLEENDMLKGYNKFIYHFHVVPLLLMLLYCVVYYS